MPTRLLLDGPNIEALLKRVRDEYGDHARIVHAERVRSGGIAGFFPKERYEVTVEVEDGYGSARKSAKTVASPTEGVEDQPLAVLLAEAMNEIGGNLEDLVDTKPRISTSTPAFAEVLGSVASGLGVDAETLPTSSPSSVPTFIPAVHPKKRSAVASTYGATSQVAETEVITHGVVAQSAVVPATAQVAQVETAPAIRPVPARQFFASDIQVQPPRPPRGRGQVLAMVGEVGPTFTAGLEIARRMRISPNRVLVASPDQIVPGVLVSRRVPDAIAARKRSAKLMSEPMPSVVAVDLPISGIWDDEIVDWSKDIVSSIGAIQVWAVVDATRKFSDLSRWLARLGQVNALVVHNAAITDDLFSILDLGYPVAMLDDRPATSAVWRSMLRASGGSA